MMKLLDDLYIGIPSNIRIDNCVIGKKWVTVRANGNVGIAKMIGEPEHEGSEFGGKWLRDVAGHLYWHDLTEAAVGAAALNAWYNSPGHIAQINGWYNTDTHKKFYETLKYDDYAYCEGKRTAVVGDCPFFELTGRSADRFELPIGEKIDEEKYKALAGYDVVVLSADAITARSVCALLAVIGESGYVVIDGVSAPASPCFFAFDMPVKRVNGFFERFDYTMEDAARLDLESITPGVYSFSLEPIAVPFCHEDPRLQNYLNSPYSSTAYNSRFNSDWEGREYNKDEWDPIYKG